MAEKEGRGKHGQLWFIGVFSLLALVIGYSIYSGVSLKKVEVPGIINVEFGGVVGGGHDSHAAVPPPASPPRVATTPVSIPAPQPAAPGAPVSNAAPPPRFAPPAVVNLSGLWFNDEGLQYNIIQYGDEISLQEINPQLGGMVTAEGEGVINGATIELDLTTVLGISGTADLQVSADGRWISGTFSADGSYQALPLNLYRQ